MTQQHREMQVETLPIDDLTPWPGNARQGDRARIRTSRRHHGQYKPILAQLSSNRIVAGNNFWADARDDGWTEIQVIRLDITDDEALRINIADNRTSDMASYDRRLLLEQFSELPDLDGTGYHLDELDELRNTLDQEDTPPTTGDAPDEQMNNTYGVYVYAHDEPHQAQILEALSSRGYRVRAI